MHPRVLRRSGSADHAAIAASRELVTASERACGVLVVLAAVAFLLLGANVNTEHGFNYPAAIAGAAPLLVIAAIVGAAGWIVRAVNAKNAPTREG